MNQKKANRLVNEKSPYLLQHAYNPVDWYPWGEEAFAAAREQDKPIFLSIGYSTCHWCHVMEHESFEDSSVAALMNETFINIKVDREERPDVDDIYMTAIQMTGQNGGWPLTAILTPDREPFFMATYIPRMSQFNRMGMLDLVPRIAGLWKNERPEVHKYVESMRKGLQQVVLAPPGEALTADLLARAVADMKERYDAVNGGFGERPKFPTAHNLMFLLRQYRRSGDPQLLAMVEHSLQQMRLGGVYDHVGFGIHRYATDAKWLLPHFEKMLYDQALLTMALTETFQVTANDDYERTAREVLTYVLRDMTDARGGFYSAEDADSEGEEGKFYVWTDAQVREVLGDADGDLFSSLFNFEEGGNFQEEASGHRTGANIPHLQKPLADLAAKQGMSPEALRKKVETLRRKLFDVREKRIHPLKDDKVLTDWNGLMIAALCKAARAFDEPQYARAAEKAARFILAEMRDDSGRLMHRYREGDVAIRGYLDDHAFMIWGLLELYETTFDASYLSEALRLNEALNTHFHDEEKGAYFFTANDGEALLIRKKEIYDGAIPSGNSVQMLNLLRLARITGREDLAAQAEDLGKAFSPQVERFPAGYTVLMLALDFAVGPSLEIVVAGDPRGADTRAMLARIHRAFLPNKVLLQRPAGEDDPPIVEIADYTRMMTSADGKAIAYVCRNYACELPTGDADKMMQLIEKNATGESHDR